MVSFLSTVVFDVKWGLMISFIFSLLTIVVRAQTPRASILGRLPLTNLYRSVKDYPQVCNPLAKYSTILVLYIRVIGRAVIPKIDSTAFRTFNTAYTRSLVYVLYSQYM